MPAKSRSYSRPDIPEDEDVRLQDLYELKLLDTASDVRFDRYTSLVADIFDFPVVLITLIDRNRQWFKSACGLDLRESDRDISFCAHAINQHGVMVVPDTRADPRFSGNPWVTGYPYIGFYAGTVVHSPAGRALGTLCVIDHKPREFDDKQCHRLRRFADLVEHEIQHKEDLERLRSSVEFSAYYDPLTELPNRRLLIDRLTKLLELSEQASSQVAVLLVNITGLRLLNQSLGTPCGDELLRQVGQRLRSSCPPGGSLSRLQADEFVMAFASIDGESSHLQAVIERTRLELRKPFQLGEQEHYINIHIGCSMFPEHGLTPLSLIERASAAIRFTEDEASSGMHFYTHQESINLSQRLKIESSLRGAVEKRQLRLVYQPIVSISDGKMVGVEALLRWRHPELGQVAPDTFIPIAEQTGLIVSIGRWVQEEVCRQIRHWQHIHRCDIPVSINVAAAELLHPEFTHQLINLMTVTGIDSKLIWIEATESSVLSDHSMVDNNLSALREHGIEVCIDDFGTGYSSLAYVHRLPVNKLKIDRSFIGGAEDGPTMALIQAIVSMGKALNLGLVAEGVETKAQLGFLTKTQCQFIQGYLAARPVDAKHIPRLLNRKLI